MIEIPLTKGFVALIDEVDEELICPRKWCADVNKTTVYACSGKPKVLMHRLIMNATKGLVVDHRNHNGLDNRRNNLRLTTRFGNSQNTRRPISKNGFRGVHTHPEAKSKPYYAQIKANGQTINSAYFVTAIEAAVEYDRLATLHHGGHAILNFKGDQSDAL